MLLIRLLPIHAMKLTRLPSATRLMLAFLAGTVLLTSTSTATTRDELPDPAAIGDQPDVPAPQPISDEVLGEEYDAYRQSVKGMKMYKVSYILLPDEASARDWLARIRAGADFAKVAREHSKHPESASRGGALGAFATCRWARDTLAMLDALKPGQLHNKPVKGSHGWAIYRLDAVEPLEPISFAQYKSQLLSGNFKPECPWVPPVTVGVPRSVD